MENMWCFVLDLEKANDTTWKYMSVIMNDVYDMDLKGHLAPFYSEHFSTCLTLVSHQSKHLQTIERRHSPLAFY